MDLKRWLLGASYIGISGTLCFVLRCPENKAKQLRSGSVCQNPSEYHCLLNYSSKQYIETCKTTSWMVEGTYAVLNNLYINDEPCIAQELQPFVILSNEANKCTYKKDLCTGKGQIILSNGTASSNRRCRCDYKKGYSFVTKPSQICYCDPGQEDCSCVLLECGHNKELQPDYVCREKNQTNREIQTCPNITQIERDIEYIQEQGSNGHTDTQLSIDLCYRNLPVILVTFLGVAVTFFCLLGITNANLSAYIDAVLKYLWTVCYTRNKRADLQPKSGDIGKLNGSNNLEGGRALDIKFDDMEKPEKALVPKYDEMEKPLKALLPATGDIEKPSEANLPKSDDTEKQSEAPVPEPGDMEKLSEVLVPESDEMTTLAEALVPDTDNRKKTGIVVLGNIAEVKECINKLKKIARNLGYNKRILYDNEQNAPLDILLENFAFIFILYTETFDINKSGLSKKDIDKVKFVKKKEDGELEKIKIVCDCKKEKVMKALGRIDLFLEETEDTWDFFVKIDGAFHKILQKLPTPPPTIRKKMSIRRKTISSITED